ncbi:MAG: GAP family protein [Patescibacteria group bacterium]|nr:GAP family protein [Patescibacteria group bacterium]
MIVHINVLDRLFCYNKIMIEVLIKILPLDIASTISPIILALTIALLAKKDYGYRRALALCGGSIIVVIILATLGLKTGQNIQDINNNNLRDNIVDLILAILFLYFGIKSLIHQDKQSNPKISLKNQSAQLIKWFSIGFIINITNFDAVILNFSAAKEIGQATINAVQKIILLVIDGLFFISPIIVPLAVYSLMPKLAQKILIPIDLFLTKYGRYIVGVIFIGFAIFLFYRGLKIP